MDVQTFHVVSTDIAAVGPLLPSSGDQISISIFCFSDTIWGSIWGALLQFIEGGGLNSPHGISWCGWE